MKYVDGLVVAIPKRKLEAYQKMSKKMGKVWMKHGALQYLECAEEKLPKKDQPKRTFQKITGAKERETVIFSFIVFKSKAHRDKVMKKVHSDPAMQDPSWVTKLPFDPKRMTFGSFKTLVEY